MELNLRLPLTADSAFSARHSLDGLKEALGAHLFNDVRLLVTELVTNSIRHARPTRDGWLDLHLRVTDDLVRAEIVDRGPGFEPGGDGSPSVTATSGRGLFLVKNLADRWGVAVGDETRVWFEMDRYSRAKH